jgi:hypothetical protein
MQNVLTVEINDIALNLTGSISHVIVLSIDRKKKKKKKKKKRKRRRRKEGEEDKEEGVKNTTINNKSVIK